MDISHLHKVYCIIFLFVLLLFFSILLPTRAEMKKVVLKLEVHDEKSKQKAMKSVSSIQGIESITMDMKETKLTVIGDVDPVCVVRKLRKLSFYVEILTVGPAKEEKKDPPPNKPISKEVNNAQCDMMIREHYYHPCSMGYPLYTTVEEYPTACVIS